MRESKVIGSPVTCLSVEGGPGGIVHGDHDGILSK